ncbi:flagellar biosynthetic protein FlhB [Anaerotignum neopropionicum]|uniref:Flagellar biosynthetic protein FlhB n=1 Tax=Anaerotignum neopropionicum TaxID=36847 RepID=A0A136WJ45_9FIRM|nr:flagellar biosynthesis protein FlhB [Anaerotignum neopropionicum]KXL54551.1 flagellar biosynthetic protein FlhB [Anaerotignum neopropionicum]
MATDSKTEKATPKRRQDERKKGNVLISKDVIAVASLIGSFFTLKLIFPQMVEKIYIYFYKTFEYAQTQTEITNGFVTQISWEIALAFVQIAAPVICIPAFFSILATVAQTKPIFVTDSLKPKFNRINPLEGMKKLFSIRSLFDVIKGIIKITILIVILYSFISKSILTVSRTIQMDVMPSSAMILDLTMSLAFKICLAFIVISAFDYFFQWWEYERQIKMSKHELKEEYKQMEGDPQIKSKIKELQRKMAMSRMMQDVPKADVVIKNPTHYAVALKYDLEKEGAPILLAKGQDAVALRIIKTAEENDVFVLENKPLARAIYATTDIHQEIPDDFYGTVAEILVHVYKLKNKKLI